MAEPPPISIVPVPSDIPTIDIDPLVESTIVPEPEQDNLPTSAGLVDLPAASTVAGGDEDGYGDGYGEESTMFYVWEQEEVTSSVAVAGGLFLFLFFDSYIIFLGLFIWVLTLISSS